MERMKFKKNLGEAIKRNRKLWGGDFRRGILAKIDTDDINTFDTWMKPLKFAPDYKKIFKVWDNDFKKREFLLDDSIPCARVSLGSSAFGGFLSGDIKFTSTFGGMSSPILENPSEVSKLKIDTDNKWYKLQIEAVKYFSKKAAKLFAVSPTETIDGLNFAENILGPRVYTDILDYPNEMRRIFDFALEFNIKLIEDQLKYISKYENGIISMDEEWMPGKSVWMSVDANGNCSAELFRKTGKEYFVKMIEYFGGGKVHIHSNGHHLIEELVDIKNLFCIEIGDDVGLPRNFPRLKEIIKKTKRVPLKIACTKEELIDGIKNKSLPGNVMYWVRSGVKSIGEANKIVELVYDYRSK